jgi:hypothetical protein
MGMSKPKDLRDGAGAPVPPASPASSEQPTPAAPEAPRPADTDSAVTPPQAEKAPRRSPESARQMPSRSQDPFRFRVGPAAMALVMIAVLQPWGIPGFIVDTLSDFVPLPVHGAPLPSAIAEHITMLLMALGAIYGFKRLFPRIDFGLHLPTGRSYVATAILLGFLFGIVMALVDHAPDIFLHRVPREYSSGYGVDMSGWLAYFGILVGPTEEIPFRSLVVGYLAMSMPGRLRFRGLEMNGAGVVVASIFAAGFGVYALLSSYFPIAVGQILYFFVWNVVLAYWFEKSRSVLAPIIGHNVALLTWQALTFWLVLAFR